MTLMPPRRSSLFLHVGSPPSPNANPTLWEHRLRQRRPVSRNPFEEEPVRSEEYGNTVIGSPGIQNEPIKFDETQASSNHDEFTKANGNYDVEWGEQVPAWLNLVSSLKLSIFNWLTFVSSLI
ncbi:hypothetical protein RSAG8_04885, partial [Rhizoctonia solani AG-8 WAC10335]